MRTWRCPRCGQDIDLRVMNHADVCRNQPGTRPIPPGEPGWLGPPPFRQRFAEVVWMNLVAACAADPPNAKRLLMVGRSDVEGAVQLAFDECGTTPDSRTVSISETVPTGDDAKGGSV